MYVHSFCEATVSVNFVKAEPVFTTAQIAASNCTFSTTAHIMPDYCTFYYCTNCSWQLHISCWLLHNLCATARYRKPWRTGEVMCSGRVGADESSTCRSDDVTPAQRWLQVPDKQAPKYVFQVWRWSVCLVPEFTRFTRDFFVSVWFFCDLGRAKMTPATLQCSSCLVGSFAAAFCWWLCCFCFFAFAFAAAAVLPVVSKLLTML